MLNEETILQTLKSVKYPGFSRDIISFGLVKQVAVEGQTVRVRLQLTSSNVEAAEKLRQEVGAVLQKLPGVSQVEVEVHQPESSGSPAAARGQGWEQIRVPGVRRIVAIASGKGGVGKSTVSVNLAGALSHLGAKVGLLDSDIYGPSIPLMMGIQQRPTISEAEKLEPPVQHGIKLMSIGFLVEGDTPVIWRGPMIVKTIQQFLGAVEWGNLDYLLVDLPPGTGDTQLTLCQTVHLDGGVVVTTPQEASLGVVRKGIGMFQKLNVPLLGLVENMSYFITPAGDRVEIFGHGGGRAEALRQGIPFLGEVPIFTEIREGGDRGIPVTVSAPRSAPGQAFLEIARQLQQQLS